MSSLYELFNDRPCTWWSNGIFTVTQENTMRKNKGTGKKSFFPKQLAKVAWSSGGSSCNYELSDFEDKFNEACEMKEKLDNTYISHLV